MASVEPAHTRMAPSTTQASLVPPLGMGGPGVTPSTSEAGFPTSSLATDSTTTLTTLFPPPGMRGVPQPPVSTKELIIIIFMFCFWAYSLFLTYRSSSGWKAVTVFCQGLVQAALLRWGREDQHVGFHHGRGEEEEKGGRSSRGGGKQGNKRLPNQGFAFHWNFQDREESEPLNYWGGEESQMSDRYEANNGNSHLPKKPIYTEVWFQYKERFQSARACSQRELFSRHRQKVGGGATNADNCWQGGGRGQAIFDDCWYMNQLYKNSSRIRFNLICTV